MTAVNSKRYRGTYSIKTIWGIAKSPELQLTDTELHDIVVRETGKDSIRKLTQSEINMVVYALQKHKDSAKGVTSKKRTDESGNEWTTWQRRKVHELTGQLGWNDNNARIDGFVKKMFGLDSIKWLHREDCSKLIEMLKKMVKRKEEAEWEKCRMEQENCQQQ